jgi:hypothetical protein
LETATDRNSTHEAELLSSKTWLECKSGIAVQQLLYKRYNTWPHGAETCGKEGVDESTKQLHIDRQKQLNKAHTLVRVTKTGSSSGY